jgi:uncharacterized protein
MRNVMFVVLCALALAPAVAAAAEGGAPEEAVMDGGGMPQVQPGDGSHPLCWLEIQAKDIEASRKFYGELFGWTFQEFEAMPGYVMYTPPAGLPGALSALPESLANAQQTTTPYILTADIDAELAALEARGLKITQPKTPVFDWGFVAMFEDGAGTTYGLSTMSMQQPIPHLPPDFGSATKPPAGTLWSIELYGGDLDQAKALFGEHFGWGTLGTMPQYMMFDPGAGIGGVFQGHTAVAKSLPYIWVDDVRAKIAEIVAAGGRSLGEPASMPGMGTFGYFVDPNGVGMGLFGP